MFLLVANLVMITKKFQSLTVGEILPKKKKSKSDKSNSDEGRQTTDEDYENYLRHKPVSIGLYNITTGDGYNQQSLQPIDCYSTPRMKIINRQPVITNGERIVIVDHIVQLIFNCFGAKLHV